MKRKHIISAISIHSGILHHSPLNELPELPEQKPLFLPSIATISLARCENRNLLKLLKKGKNWSLFSVWTLNKNLCRKNAQHFRKIFFSRRTEPIFCCLVCFNLCLHGNSASNGKWCAIDLHLLVVLCFCAFVVMQVIYWAFFSVFSLSFQLGLQRSLNAIVQFTILWLDVTLALNYFGLGFQWIVQSRQILFSSLNLFKLLVLHQILNQMPSCLGLSVLRN